MGSTIKTVLDLDLTKFKSNAQEAVSIAGRTIGAGVSSAVERKLGPKDAFKGLVAGIGISVESIAEKITEPWKKAAEAADRILENTKETLATYQRIFSGRRTDLQNVEQLDKDRDRLLKELETTKARSYTTPVRVPYSNKTIDAVTNVPENTERASEIAKELAENAAKREEFSKKITTETKKTNEESFKGEQELADLKEKNARDDLTTQAKINELEKKREELSDPMGLGGANVQFLIEAEKLEGEILQLKRAQHEESLQSQKQDRETLKTRELELTRLKAEVVDAKLKVSDAKKDIQDAHHDALSFSLTDASGGKRGNQTDRAKAKQIESLEKRAQRALDSGSTFRDPNGRTVSSQNYAEGLMGRARNLRSDFTRLKTSDQNPDKAMEKQLRDANSHLEKIQKSLEVVEMETTD